MQNGEQVLIILFYGLRGHGHDHLVARARALHYLNRLVGQLPLSNEVDGNQGLNIDIQLLLVFGAVSAV